MQWTEQEAKAIDRLITAYGAVKSLDEESREKVFDYAVKFHMVAFDIEEKEPPKGMII